MANFNVSPYYDDFDSAKLKNYLRILFKPGVPVQARELTQIQSILQNQVSQFGDHIFKNGATILGARINPILSRKCITADVTETVNSSDWDGKIVTNGSGAEGEVKYVDTTNKKIFIERRSGQFTAGDTVYNASTIGSSTASITATTITDSLFASIDNGIMYLNGLFIIVSSHEALVDPDGYTGSYYIGVELTETFVTANDDSTLNDNATGSSNFNAPGADRYQVDVVLKGYKTSDTIPDTFVSLMEMDNSVIVKRQNDIPYSRILDIFARRTFDESGNYTSKDFTMHVEEDTSSTTTFNAILSPGKAYVNGYESEILSDTIVAIDKAKDTALANNVSAYFDYGTYFDVKLNGTIHDINGIFDITNHELVELMSSTNGTGNIIGEARITNLDESPDGGNLRVYISEYGDIRNLFTAVRSIRSKSTPTTYANVDVDATLDFASVGNVGSEPIVFPLTNNKVVKDLVLSSAVYEVNKKTTSAVTSGSATISVTDGIITNITAVVDSSTGAFLDQATYYTISGINTSTVTLTEVSPLPANIDVLFKVKKSGTSANYKTKTLTEVTYEILYADSSGTNNVLTDSDGNDYLQLANIDIFEIVSVDVSTDGGATWTSDSVSNYTFDSGQRDLYYDYGRLYNVSAGTSKQYRVTYRYWSHSGTGDYFCANSYIYSSFYSDDDFYKIRPMYFGEFSNFDLMQCIDFRKPILSLSSGDVIEPFSSFLCDYNYYLNRIDKVYITQNGEFGVRKGISSLSPAVPTDVEGTLTLFILYVPANTVDVKEVGIEKLDTRRYTMRDIGNLERRIERLEYYSSLNSLEKDVSDLSILDENGLNKFKNGFIVDNFTSETIANIAHPEFSGSIDINEQYFRAPYSLNSIDFVEADDAATMASKNIKSHDVRIMLDYTTTPFIEQLKASEWMNVNPFSVFAWLGKMKIAPSSDNWMDETRQPTQTIDVNTGLTNSLQTMAQRIGVQWDGWEQLWTTSIGAGRNISTQDLARRFGVDVIDGRGTQFTGNNVTTRSFRPTQATGWWGTGVFNINGWQWRNTRVTRWRANNTNRGILRPNRRQGGNVITGNRITMARERRVGGVLDVINRSTRQSIGDRVVDMQLIPWIRTRGIQVTLEGLKPNTDLLWWFDDVSVDAWIADSSYNFIEAGWSNGTVYNVNDIVLYNDQLYICTVGGTSSGTNPTDDVGATWTTFSGTTITTDSSGKASALFIIPNTDNLKFKTGDRALKVADHPTQPATSAEAVYTAQGFLKTLQSTDLNIENPTIRERRVTGEERFRITDVLETRRTVVYSDPLAQTFLVTLNGGVFIESVELFFKSKDSSVPVIIEIVETENGYPTQNVVPFGSVVLDPSSVNLSTNGSDNPTKFTFDEPIYLQESSEYAIVVKSNSNNYECFVAKIGDVDLSTNQVISEQPYTGSLFKSQNASTWSADQYRDLTFRINRCVFPTGVDGTLDLITDVDQSYNATTAYFNLETREAQNTSIDYSYKFNGTSGDTVYQPFLNRENKELEVQKEITPTAQLNTRLVFRTDVDHLTPVLNKQRASFLAINNEVTGTTAPYGAGTYVTTDVTLLQPSDDIRVIVDAYKPSNASMKVFVSTGGTVERYVDGAALNTNLQAQDCTVYWRDSASDVITKKGYVTVTKTKQDTNTGGIPRYWVTGISNYDAFVATADHATYSIDKVFITLSTDDVDGDTISDWSSATSYIPGDYAFDTVNGELWKCILGHTNQDPADGNAPAYWEKVESAELTTSISDDSGTYWRELVLDGTENQTNRFDEAYYEYTYKPDGIFDETFVIFTVKIELYSQNKIDMPRIKNFRAIALY